MRRHGDDGSKTCTVLVENGPNDVIRGLIRGNRIITGIEKEWVKSDPSITLVIFIFSYTNSMNFERLSYKVRNYHVYILSYR